MRLDPFAPTIDLPCDIDKSRPRNYSRRVAQRFACIYIILRGVNFKLPTINEPIRTRRKQSRWFDNESYSLIIYLTSYR